MITSTQSKIYQIIKTYINQHGYAPSLREIAAELGIGPKSISLISRYLTVLEQEGLIRLLPKRQRNIELVQLPGSALPLLGRIAAGKPIEAIPNRQMLDFSVLLKNDDLYALEVRGDSMIEEGILDGDKVICRHQTTAKENDIVVALINQQEATLKRISYKIKDHITLIPANSTLSPQIYPASWIQIQGVYVGLLRLEE